VCYLVKNKYDTQTSLVLVETQMCKNCFVFLINCAFNNRYSNNVSVKFLFDEKMNMKMDFNDEIEDTFFITNAKCIGFLELLL